MFLCTYLLDKKKEYLSLIHGEQSNTSASFPPFPATSEMFICGWAMSYPRLSHSFQTSASETSTSQENPSPLGVEARPMQLQKCLKARNMKALTLIYGWAWNFLEFAFHSFLGAVGFQNHCFCWNHSRAVLFSVDRALGWCCTSLSVVLCLLMDPTYQLWGKECWRGGSASRTSCPKVLFIQIPNVRKGAASKGIVVLFLLGTVMDGTGFAAGNPLVFMSPVISVG